MVDISSSNPDSVMPGSNTNLLIDGWRLLTPRQRLAAGAIVVFFVFSGVVELAALSAAVPFISVLIEPDFIERNEILREIRLFLGSPSLDDLVLYLGLGTIALLVAGYATNMVSQFLADWFGVRVAMRLAAKLVSECLNAPYLWFLRQNAPTLAQQIYSDPISVGGALFPAALELIYTSILTLLVVAAVVAIAPWQSLLSVLAITAVAVVILYFVRPLIIHYAAVLRDRTFAHNRICIEFISGIKDIKVKNRGSYFSRLHHQVFRATVVTRMITALLGRMTPITLLMIGQIGLILVAIALFTSEASRGEIAAQMAFLVLVMSRLLPSASRVAGTFNKMIAVVPHVNGINRVFAEIALMREAEIGQRGSREVPPQWQRLELTGVDFTYPGISQPAIHQIDMTIERGGAYGIVGMSGAGKSTLVDIVLRLLPADRGEIRLDGQPVSDFTLKSWYGQIGYVPQSPFISDDTLRRNVAFGLEASRIDDQRVLRALSMAGLEEVVESLDQGLDTGMGDRGLRLSGGQRQRVAVARALHDEPNLLILDEATSALDTVTERAVQDTIERLHGAVTTITIAHRLTTIMRCDRLFLMDAGRLVDSGTYDELLAGNALFRKMADAGSRVQVAAQG